MDRDVLEDWLRLRHAPEVGPATLARLLARFSTPGAILAAPGGQLRALGLGDRALAVLDGREVPPGVSADLRWAEGADHHILTLDDPRYPPILREIAAPPGVLYVIGDPDVLADPQLAVVGSRHPTPGGTESARAFAAHLARSGLVITSGLALGIDAAAHQGALDAHGATVAVMATGPDRIYPARHKDLAHRIARGGALVSEFPVGTHARAEHFPQRNRLISGLSAGTLVVEAALGSGSLITARCASEQGREVFAMPGSIHNPVARGCHRLIRQGAKLVETADDVLEELAAILRPVTAAAAPPSPAADDAQVSDEARDPDHERLLEAMGFDPVTVDQMVSRTGLTVEAVSSMLLLMELRGQVASLSGGRYVRHQPEP
ncbi:DNA-processing protein DprA [Thioalkalivibrio thiocyanodenitrificans]|uniref:DNA-processing protein DprA n=1 Tax=Thioalkalivibrio thiocyanodenitrificans TaxID=243063 RepID=UPI00037464B9|nr:DNA-processing protein DprA [Thioalkalivibrio thiocyanodenitrificans]